MGDSTLGLIVAGEILLVGTIFFVLPWIGRRGLLFGVYVGEAGAGSGRAREIAAGWYRDVALVVIAALAVLVPLALWSPNPGLASAGLLIALIGFVLAYLKAHRAAHELAAIPEPEPAAATAPEHLPPSATIVPAITIALVIGVSAFVVIRAFAALAEMPERIPVHFDFAGRPDRWADRSLAQALALPVLAVIVGGFIALLGLLVVHAKRSLRASDSGADVRAQLAFRLAVSRFLCGEALLLAIFFALMQQGQIRVATGRAETLGSVLFGVGALIVYSLGGVVYLMTRYGQGGARIEGAAAGDPLTDGLADNRFWKWGLFYINRDDPAMLVEKRFGLGYTINLGNWKAIALFVGFFVLLAGVALVLTLLG